MNSLGVSNSFLFRFGGTMGYRRFGVFLLVISSQAVFCEPASWISDPTPWTQFHFKCWTDIRAPQSQPNFAAEGTLSTYWTSPVKGNYHGEGTADYTIGDTFGKRRLQQEMTNDYDRPYNGSFSLYFWIRARAGEEPSKPRIIIDFSSPGRYRTRATYSNQLGTPEQALICEVRPV
jgi:hypothetical protein